MRLLDLLLPACCALCGRGGEPVCPACVRALPLLGGPACARCGKPTVMAVADCRECRGRRLGFDAAVAAVAFEGRGRDLVLRFKDGGLRGLAATAAGVVATVCPPPECELLTWVPGDRWRTLRRGYHPAQELALGLADRWGPGSCCCWLAAASAPRPARRRRGRVSPWRVPAVRAPRGAHRLVETLHAGRGRSACAGALRRGGAARVGGVTRPGSSALIEADGDGSVAGAPPYKGAFG